MFKNCTSLNEIKVSENNGYYSSVDGVLFNKEKTTLIACPVGKTGKYVIPDSVTSIEDYAFYGCYNLTTITMGDNVTSIGESAFEYCELISVTIGNSVTSIGNSAFSFCDTLTSVTIPNGVMCIGSFAFYSCSSLTDVYYEGSEEEWQQIEIESYNEGLTDATIHYNYVPEVKEVKIEYSIENGAVIVEGENITKDNKVFAITIINGAINATMLDLTDGSETIEMPEGAEKVKIFVWESLESMKPLCEAITVK